MSLFSFLQLPIIQAPMAGGITTPEFVAAVCNAGALGSMGAGYMTPQQIKSDIQKIKALTSKPFQVNLFIPEITPADENITLMKNRILPLWAQVSKDSWTEESTPPPSFEEQAEALLEEKIPIFSFTFGCLSPHWVQRFQKQGCLVLGTATTPEEAKQLEQAGVDAIVCQGQEAGGHRGNFSPHDPLYSLMPLLLLTKQAVKTPLIAAGGIMNGHAVKAILLLGAIAAQMGTAFLTTTESGASSSYKEAILKKPQVPTKLTKAFTGKVARAIPNLLMHTLEEVPIPSYPTSHFLTSNLRQLASKKNRPDLLSLWAGQGYPLCQEISVRDLIHRISQELI
ncbi:MAG: nitronate monooxygenase [Rhabdochlamydiaceae bacterium]|nr:nitronate monooxygenase [Rhabdochlamydiaceae bacterium]